MRMLIEGPEPELVDFEEILDNASGQRRKSIFYCRFLLFNYYYKTIIS